MIRAYWRRYNPNDWEVWVGPQDRERYLLIIQHYGRPKDYPHLHNHTHIFVWWRRHRGYLLRF